MLPSRAVIFLHGARPIPEEKICNSQICLLWKSTGSSCLAHHLEPKRTSSQRSSSQPLCTPNASMDKQPGLGGPHGPSTSPSQRYTMDPVLEISTTEPEMSYLSTLHAVHHHHHRHRNNTPRYDEKEKQWTRKQKSINIFPPIRAAQTACGRRDTRVHWGGEKEQPGSSEGRKATVLRRSCIPCLGTCRQCRHPVTS